MSFYERNTQKCASVSLTAGVYAEGVSSPTFPPPHPFVLGMGSCGVVSTLVFRACVNNPVNNWERRQGVTLRGGQHGDPLLLFSETLDNPYPVLLQHLFSKSVFFLHVTVLPLFFVLSVHHAYTHVEGL